MRRTLFSVNRCFLKLISLIMVFVLLFVSPNFVIAMTTEVNVREISVIGEKMSVVDYKDLYGKPIGERSKKEELISFQSAVLTVNEISIINDSILFDYSISNHQQTVTGKLYNSSRDMNNIVAVFDDNTNNCEILFFEIAQGTQEVNLLYNQDLNGKPHIKIYFQFLGNMYLFELALPNGFENIVVKHNDRCEITKDYLWYLNVVDGYKTTSNLDRAATMFIDDEDPNAVIKRNIAIASGAKSYDSQVSVATITPTTPMMWGGREVYEMTVTNGVDQTTYMFYPYGYMRGSNVLVGANSTWWCSVEVSEHTATKMITNPGEPTIVHGINRFSVRNPQISIVSGDYTMMVRTMFDGKTMDLGGGQKTTGQKIASKVFSKVLQVVPYGKTVEEIKSWVSTITTNVSNEIDLGGPAISLNSSITAASKLSVDSDYVFNKHTEATGGGHKIVMQVDLTRTTSTTAMTFGVIQVDYNVYTNLYDLYDSDSERKTFRYSDTNFDNGVRDDNIIEF